MSNRDPLPPMLLGVFAIIYLAEDPFCACALMFVWAVTLFCELEALGDAQKRGDLLKWSLEQPT